MLQDDPLCPAVQTVSANHTQSFILDLCYRKLAFLIMKKFQGYILYISIIFVKDYDYWSRFQSRSTIGAPLRLGSVHTRKAPFLMAISMFSYILSTIS